MIGTTFADLLLDYIKTAVLSRKKGACNLQTPLMVLRILSRKALRMTYNLVIAKPCKRLWQSVFPILVIAVRVSGGHLCEAEAPTEPAGETAERCVAIRPLPLSSLRSRVNGCGNPFPHCHCERLTAFAA